MHLVVLDKASFDCGDLDFTLLESLDLDITYFANSKKIQVISRIENADIIITNKVVIDADAMSHAHQLKLICISATGTNNVDITAATKNSVVVCNVNGYATSSVVQHVFMLITHLNTNFNRYQAAVVDNRWNKSPFFCLLDFPITDLAQQTLGIIGYGELGQAVAQVAKSFGMTVLVAESLNSKSDQDISRTKLDAVLLNADIVSLHCPLTDRTRNLISVKELQKMKASALLINTARGGIVNETDLLHALQNNIIGGAGLDVLEQEPPKENHPLLNAKLENLIVTPHIAWASQTSRQRLIDDVATNIKAFLQNKVRNRVNN